MKIWHITSEICCPPRLTGGMGVHVSSLASEQVKMGHDVSIFCPLKTGRVVDGVRYRPWAYRLPRMESQLSFTLCMAQETVDYLFDTAKEEAPDIIHGHEWDAAPVYTRLANFSDIPCIGTLHISNILNRPFMTPLWSEQESFFLWWEQEFLHRVDGIIAISKYFRDWINIFKPKAPVRQIYNGVDVSAFKGGEDIERPTDKTLAFFHGRIVGQKGIGTLIDAAKIDSSICYVLAGDFAVDPDGNAMEDDLFRECKKLEEQGRMILPGLVSHKEVGAWMRLCDVAVYPHLAAPFDCAVLEALAMGIPTICTPVDALGEYTKDGHNAWHLPENPSGQDIVDKIKALADCDAAKRLITHNGMKTDSFMSWKVCATETTEFYKEIINGKDKTCNGLERTDPPRTDRDICHV